MIARASSLHEDEAPFELGVSPSHLLHRVEQLANDRFAQLVGDAVTLRQFTVLAAVAAAPNCSQRDLARRTGIDLKIAFATRHGGLRVAAMLG